MVYSPSGRIQLRIRPGLGMRRDQCPSCADRPLLKGTTFVREAVNRLKEEGYAFNYIEVRDVPRRRILDELGRSHIVLQEFHLLPPGYLCIEALARGNAVLASATSSVNPELPPDWESAWIPTRCRQIYDHLKRLPDNPPLIEHQARAGRRFVEEDFTVEKARTYYQSVLARRGGS